MLNVPKSGSSFARKVIKDIHAERRHSAVSRKNIFGLLWSFIYRPMPGQNDDDFLVEIICPNIRLPGRAADQHGTYSQIPNRFKDLPIISIIRDPYEKIVSDFTFRWWAKYPPVPIAELKTAFPEFPDLGFDQFLQMSRLTAKKKLNGANPLGLGNLTIEFIQFFFRDPIKVLQILSGDYIRSGSFRNDMPDIEFISQNCLNEELAGVLKRFGYSLEEQEVCRNQIRVNESMSRIIDGPIIWTKEMIDAVQSEEAYLFLMLEHLGFSYKKPVPLA